MSRVSNEEQRLEAQRNAIRANRVKNQTEGLYNESLGIQREEKGLRQKTSVSFQLIADKYMHVHSRNGDVFEFDAEHLLYKFNKHLHNKVQPSAMLVQNTDIPTYLTKDRLAPNARMSVPDFFAKNAINNIEYLQDYCQKIMTGTLSTDHLQSTVSEEMEIATLCSKSQPGNPFPKPDHEDSFNCTRYTKVAHLDTYMQRLYDNKDDRQSYYETLQLRATISQLYDATSISFQTMHLPANPHSTVKALAMSIGTQLRALEAAYQRNNQLYQLNSEDSYVRFWARQDMSENQTLGKLTKQQEENVKLAKESYTKAAKSTMQQPANKQPFNYRNPNYKGKNYNPNFKKRGNNKKKFHKQKQQQNKQVSLPTNA